MITPPRARSALVGADAIAFIEDVAVGRVNEHSYLDRNTGAPTRRRAMLGDMVARSASAWLSGEIALWIKVVYTLYLCVLVPVYAVKYGPSNFLWFSDIALLVTAVALWTENALLASMMAVAVIVPELAWNIGFFLRLIFGVNIGQLSAYMFDPRTPLYLRALSLFHVVLPVLLVWLVYRLGYDRRAWLAQTVLALVILPVTYWLTEPADNINWVFGPGNKPQQKLPPLLYLGLLMVFFPVAVYLPTHWILLKLFGRH